MNTVATNVSPSRFRRSERIRELNVKKEQDLQKIIRESKIDAKSVVISKPKSKLRARSKSVAFNSNITTPTRSTTTPANRNNSGSLGNSNQLTKSKLRARTKSVAFDLNVPTPQRSITQPSRNILVNSTVPAPVVYRLLVRDASIQCDIHKSTALDHHSYEARIDSLIQSNENKIDRIKRIPSSRNNFFLN